MTGTAATSELAPLRPLTIFDVCDSCGAQAYFRAVFASGELTFCGHHGRKLIVPLRKHAILVEDGTSQINQQPNPTAD